MVDSNNIEVMRENIKELDQKVDALDVEIPAHTSSDSGKYLGVASDGSLAFSKVPDELPATTGATAGQIISLNSNKDPEWSDNYNLDYSTSEITTNQKWIDGNDIYSKVITGTFPVITESTSVDLGTLEVDDIVNTVLVIKRTNNTIIDLSNYSVQHNPTNNVLFISNVGSPNSESAYHLIVYYTKPAPTPETKKKKTTK